MKENRSHFSKKGFLNISLTKCSMVGFSEFRSKLYYTKKNDSYFERRPFNVYHGEIW